MWTSFCKKFYVKRKRDAENFIKHLTVPSQRCQCALRQAACDAGSPLPEYVTPLVVVRQWLADFEDKKKTNENLQHDILRERYVDAEKLRLLKFSHQSRANFEAAKRAIMKQYRKSESNNNVLTASNIVFDHRSQHGDNTLQTLSQVQCTIDFCIFHS